MSEEDEPIARVRRRFTDWGNRWHDDRKNDKTKALKQEYDWKPSGNTRFSEWQLVNNWDDLNFFIRHPRYFDVRMEGEK